MIRIIVLMSFFWSACLGLSASDGYKADWCLGSNVQSKVVLDGEVLVFRVTNTGKETRKIRSLLGDDFLKYAVEVEVPKKDSIINRSDAFTLFGNGVPGMGSEIFIRSEIVLDPNQTIERRLNIFEAMKVVKNKQLQAYLEDDVIKLRIRIYVELSYLVPEEQGRIEFVSPFREFKKINGKRSMLEPKPLQLKSQ